MLYLILGGVWFLLTTLVGALMWASQVAPDQAASNLSIWAQRLFGIKDPPQWFKDKSFDRKIRRKAMFVLAALLFAGGFIAGSAYEDYFGTGTPSARPQFAKLRVRYTASTPIPEVLESENVLKPMTFQWAEDGSDAEGPKRNAKWTLLVLTFDRPITGENTRVLFEGGEIPYERKTLTKRNASFLFTGPVGNKTIQIEVRP